MRLSGLTLGGRGSIVAPQRGTFHRLKDGEGLGELRLEVGVVGCGLGRP